MTEPRVYNTLPYLTQLILVFSGQSTLSANFSIKALVIPIALIGYTLLSVLNSVRFLTLLEIAASITFLLPIILVFMCSQVAFSPEGTCFKAAA